MLQSFKMLEFGLRAFIGRFALILLQIISAPQNTDSYKPDLHLSQDLWCWVDADI